MFPAIDKALPLLDPEIGSISSIYLNRKLLWFSDCASASATCNEWAAACERLAYLNQVPENKWAESLDHEIKPLFGGGLAVDPGMAILKSMGECVERMAGRVRKNPRVQLIRAKPRDLRTRGLIPELEQFRCLRDDQFLDPKVGLRPMDPELEMSWAVARDLRGAPGYVPLSMAVLSASLPMHERLVEPFSTGLACHQTYDEARLSGLCEVLERDAFMGMWLNRLSAPRVDLESCRQAGSGVADRLDELANTEFEVWVHDLTTEFGVPTYMAGLHSNYQPYTLVAASTNHQASKALEHALMELLMGLVYCIRHGEHQGEYPMDPPFADVMEHAELYAFRDLRDRFAFLRAADVIPFQEKSEPQCSPTEQLHDIVGRLEIRGYRPLFLDMGLEEFESCGFHVAKAVVPGLVPLHNKPWHAPLGATRLPTFEHLFPRRIVFPETDNPWHHPFP